MNNSEIINRLNELFEESIIKLPYEKVWEDISQKENLSFQKHLSYIRRLNTKAKAELQREVTVKAKEILNSLISEIGRSELIKRLLTQPKYKILVPQLFSKFTEISDEDKESMLTDRKFMELVRELKKDIENEENS